MKSLKLIFILFLSSLVMSCGPDDPIIVKTTYTFTFNWDGTPVSVADFGGFNYVNEHGESLSIERMRYLISNITFNHSDGTSAILDGYNLVDLTNSTGLTYAPTTELSAGDYSSIDFTFGFDDEDNKESYPDLNSANWNWPAMLGGGYHFMQFEGKFVDTNGDNENFAYHNGTARITTDEFEVNHFTASIDGFELTGNAEIEIQMNIAEWFKNPEEWDLNEFHAPLMPIYEAQKMMNRNGASVFSLGTVTQ